MQATYTDIPYYNQMYHACKYPIIYAHINNIGLLGQKYII